MTSHADGVVSRTPGKLYIAGEYAVVEPGHRAVLVAIDRFITVRVTPCVTEAGRAGTISSSLYPAGSLTWQRRRQDGLAETIGGDGDYVVAAIRVVEQLAREAGSALRSFDLDISSELDDRSGRKLGLGSSSAVTVATVRAVADLYDLGINDLTAYKLAMLASDSVQPIGSGGDIAAGAFTGWVAYTSPDRSWLRRAWQRAEAGSLVSDLVGADWPGLSIRHLSSPSLRLQVGWTGAPASTPALVADVQAGSRNSDDDYAVFLQDSQNCLASLITAIEDDDTTRIMCQIARNRALLARLSRISGRTIETVELTRLVEIAQKHGAAAKSSGAGGGDCGIALCPPATDLTALRAAWETAGIRPLDLSVYSQGSPAASAVCTTEAPVPTGSSTDSPR